MLPCAVFPTTPRLRIPAGFWAVLLLLAVAVGLFWPLLTGQKTLYYGDLLLYFIPQLAFQKAELARGVVPLWNPYILCGTPFAGNPQAWTFYPSSALLYLLSAPVAAGVIGVAHVVFAGIGTLLFLRSRGLRTSAALLGAFAFAFSGAFVSKFQFPNMAQAASFLPWLLWGIERIVVRPTAARAAAQGALIGLALLAAHPQMFMMQFYLCAAYALWRVWGPALSHQRKTVVAACAVSLTLGGALAAVQILPVVDHMRVSVRAALTLQTADRFMLSFESLLTNFVLPNFWGNPATSNYTGHGNFWEPAAYMGVLPFVLAVAAAVRYFRAHPEVRFWSLAAVLGLWLSLGISGGLYAVAFFLLPGVNKFHDPARWLHVATFAFACLAALGLHRLLESLPPVRARLFGGLAFAVAALDLLPFVRLLNPLVDTAVWETPPPPLAAIRAQKTPGRLLHRDNSAFWRWFVRPQMYGPNDPEMVRRFIGAGAPNVPMLFGLRDAAGYEPVRRVDSDALLKYLRVGNNGQPAGSESETFLRSVGVAHVLSLNEDPAVALPAQVRTIAAHDAPPPRAALWRAWRIAPSADVARKTFLSHDGNRLPLFTGQVSPDGWQPQAGNGEPEPITCAALDETANRLVVTLPPNAPRGLLRVADSWHPGWRAWVDGVPQKVMPVDGLFRGVWVPAGTRRVVFVYRPVVFQAGLFISLCGAGILTGIVSFAATVSVHRARRAAYQDRPSA